MREQTPQEANERLKTGAILVDVREQEEFDEVHAKGALLVPLSELESRYKELSPEQDIILICRSGARSARALEFLESQGFKQLTNLAGGTLAWVEQGLPHVKQGEDDQADGQANDEPEVDMSIPAPDKEKILEALKVVKDPEIPVNVVDLGLVYDVEINEQREVDVTMTLTSVGCPVQDLIRADAELAVSRLEGVKRVTVEFVWTPPWGPDKMTEDGKRQMRMFGFNI